MPVWNFTLACDRGKASPEFDWEGHHEDIVGARRMNRVLLIDYALDAESLKAAVSHVEEIIRLGGGKVIRLEPDDLISLQEMGHESGLGWGRIHALANSSGADPMPQPVRRLSSDRPLWSWRDVSAWLAANQFISEDTAKFAAAAYEINVRLTAA